MAKVEGEMAELLEMLEHEIPGFQAGPRLPPTTRVGAETIEVVNFVATIDEIVFTFEDQLHLSRVTLPLEQRLYTPGRLASH